MYKEPHMHFCIVFLTLFGHRPFPQSVFSPPFKETMSQEKSLPFSILI